MATIIKQGPNGLGWAVDFLSGNQSATLQFPTQPTNADRDACISKYEQLWADELVTTEIEQNMAEVTA
jgi:hypothetical protein